MTMPAGKAPIYITDTKTGELVFIRTVVNLPRIFKDFKEGVEKVTDDEGKVRTERGAVYSEGHRGRCPAVHAQNQPVHQLLAFRR